MVLLSTPLNAHLPVPNLASGSAGRQTATYQQQDQTSFQFKQSSKMDVCFLIDMI